jgi:hypothetical protein
MLTSTKPFHPIMLQTSPTTKAKKFSMDVKPTTTTTTSSGGGYAASKSNMLRLLKQAASQT